VIPDPHERPLLSAAEALHCLDDVLSKSSWYSALARNEIPGARRVGGRWLISTSELAAWCGLESNGDGAHGEEERT
jgi:Helix-turn-helix domain